MAPSRQHSAGHSERWSGPSAFVNRQKQNDSMASRARSEDGRCPATKASGHQTHRGISMGAFKTLEFFLRSYCKLELSIGQNRRMGKKGWTHTPLVDYFMVTPTFQTWFHRCSTVSYCGPLLLRLHLIVRGNDN